MSVTSIPKNRSNWKITVLWFFGPVKALKRLCERKIQIKFAFLFVQMCLKKSKKILFAAIDI